MISLIDRTTGTPPREGTDVTLTLASDFPPIDFG
jgi:hypothetical protein